MSNHLTLAVAGGRKTQGLVDHCKALPTDRRVLVVTFTQTNQQELIRRLGSQVGNLHNLEVLGWYTFLLRHFAKPFLPFKFSGERVGGVQLRRPSWTVRERQAQIYGRQQSSVCLRARPSRK